jgi:FtsP/CotA-like multicopper oxidase with cupredoxin domain
LITRRHFVGGVACLAAGGLSRSAGGSAFATALPSPAEPAPGGVTALHLVAAERPTALACFSDMTLPMWTYSEADWRPVIRMRLGDRLDVVLDNRLPREGEHTSIHWHGIRLPNDQDGVPHLVQPVVNPGETFRYSFVPPDTGTFFFHPHCNSSEQMGRGLTGILIVDGDTVEPYAADMVVLLRDWLIDETKRSFRNFVTKRGASRAGTYGNVRSANGFAEADLRLPASSDCRLRLVNSDTTRVMEIAVVDTEAAVIAIDGIAVPPFALESWLLGPAMRLDLVVRAPAEGRIARIVDRRLEEVVPLVSLVGTGTAPATMPFDPAPLRAGHIAEPRIDGAERLDFIFALAGENRPAVVADDPLSALGLGSLCLSSDGFWTINASTWPGVGQSELPPPLARLALGRSYVFRLRNASKLMHPVHIHGHTFKVLRSDKRPLPVHFADTVLLLPEETVEVAFVADNPGNWMFHCHVIEHQETGMMGYVQVS